MGEVESEQESKCVWDHALCVHTQVSCGGLTQDYGKVQGCVINLQIHCFHLCHVAPCFWEGSFEV